MTVIVTAFVQSIDGSNQPFDVTTLKSVQELQDNGVYVNVDFDNGTQNFNVPAWWDTDDINNTIASDLEAYQNSSVNLPQTISALQALLPALNAASFSPISTLQINTSAESSQQKIS